MNTIRIGIVATILAVTALTTAASAQIFIPVPKPTVTVCVPTPFGQICTGG